MESSCNYKRKRLATLANASLSSKQSTSFHFKEFQMQKIAIFTGALLFILGPIFYLISPQPHFTALIPSLFGIFIAAFGMAAMNPARRKAAMHGAAGVALLGFLGAGGMGATTWPALLSGHADQLKRPLASWSMLLMFCICLVFLFLCAKSFSEARRAK
jgi:uncharacterized membrane protein YczE